RREENDGRIGTESAGPMPPPRAKKTCRNAILQQENEGRTDAKHDQWIPIQPVAPAQEARSSGIFGDGQRIDIADASPVEIARGRMMNGMGTLPVLVGSEREHAEAPPDPVVCSSGWDKCLMTTVVLDQEKTDQKSHRERQQRPVEPHMLARDRPLHGPPDQHEGHARGYQLEYAAR